MIGESNPISSIGYVNAGLFAHSVLNELFDVKEFSQLRSRVAIDTVLRSLRLLKGEDVVSEDEEFAFASYEEIDTLIRALEASDQVQSIDELEKLLSSVISQPKKKEELSKAIDFFLCLSRQAIDSTRFPQKRLPEKVRSFVQSKLPPS